MPQLPEQIRPYVAALVKYHFWILALIVPLVLVPLLFMGTGGIDALISTQKSQIESRISALRSVQGIAEHPNETWSKAVEEQTVKIEEETFAEWTRFWEEQQFLRVWPAKLGDDFLRAISALKPGANLDRPLLLRYQNMVPDLLRELPKRMGADDLMGDAAAGASGEMQPRGRGPGFAGEMGMPGGPRPGAGGARPTALVTWRGDDQARIAATFKWDKPPSTTQVLLAQEEIWIYGLFCDAIKRANASAAGVYDAPITEVTQLAVGYPAAEDQPGGQGGARIFLPQAAAGAAPGAGEEMPPPEMAASPETGMPGAAVGRPVHPRFSGGTTGGPAPPPPGEGDGAVPAQASPDDALREWIYVDFTGKPLTAAELGALPAAKLVHLVPFTLRMVMDQRRLDAFLADLAAAPIPIDVRQVRINPGTMSGQMQSSPQPSDAMANGERPFDIALELRGTVGLAPRPDRKAIGGGDVTPPGNGGGE
ncbi:MAG: hypothetical protein K8S94_08470 [Planctomycetia bacterium]|nr:hypothetical protein [Planctomycetia bacterium]